ncbi:MAG: YbaB/EbfC family nucleoid-associated protein [Betaproteobacteria bacterium TMED156]|nr:MAG: YbaB/EbfC family nucleoid-associated protein [Betaproteobacteria bacterium TMED156]|tara:strand:- start:185 stop:514 length:330 start_codon:yes stop_codon:yes gene_type:complete
MKSQIAGMMRQAQKMQDEMKKVQEHLAIIEVQGESASGKVKITTNCRNNFKSVEIDSSLISNDPDDIETLQDLLLLAINDAISKSEKMSSEKMSSVTSGLPLPPGLKPF